MKPIYAYVLFFSLTSTLAFSFDMPKMPSVPTVPELPKAPALPAANPEVENSVNNFIKKSADANTFMNKSIEALFKIIAPKEKIAAADAALKKADALQDGKQKTDLLTKVNKFRSQVVNQILNSDKTMKELGKLSPQDNVSLGKIIYNLHLATMLDKELISEGPETLKLATSDPIVLKRTDEIKSSINETKEQLENGQKLIIGVTKLAGLNGVKVELPKSAKDTAK